MEATENPRLDSLHTNEVENNRDAIRRIQTQSNEGGN